MKQSIQSIRGMNDLLPGSVEQWQRLESTVRHVTELYGYQEIRMPLLERTELFKRSIGDTTDIVEKEMYTFLDNNGESMTLRPEATASCVRAGIEHGLFFNTRIRLWYMGPMFRYERPQKGRYRQFHQFGIEAFGWPGPDIDIEIILVAKMLWEQLGISDSARLEINTLGTPESRLEYRKELVQYFETYKTSLDADSQRRLYTNPLRILDSKNPNMQELIGSAPVITNYLSSESRNHFDSLCNTLEALGINFAVNPRLVRGLDYYSGTVFEWLTDLLGAQNAICAGGRYDGLVEFLGGQAVYGAGFASGIERLVELLNLQPDNPPATSTEVYVAVVEPEAEHTAFKVSELLRNAGIRATMNCGGGKLARQLKNSDQSNAEFAIIIGESEVASNTVTLKYLRTNKEQQTVNIDDLAQFVKQELDKRNSNSEQTRNKSWQQMKND